MPDAKSHPSRQLQRAQSRRGCSQGLVLLAESAFSSLHKRSLRSALPTRRESVLCEEVACDKLDVYNHSCIASLDGAE